MKALVTGSTGFVGRHLVPHLRAEGLAVATAGRGAGVDHAVADPADVAHLTSVLAAERPDCVFHLAGIARARDVLEFYRVNTVYAAALLEAVRAAGLRDAVVLLLGTAAEYGEVEASALPVTEATPERPVTHYGISKLGQTHHARAASAAGLKTIVARAFNILGPGMPKHLALPEFAAQIAAIRAAGGAGTLRVGNLQTSRDFVDVRDVARILLALVRNPESVGRVVNLCSGVATSMATLLDRLIAASGCDIAVEVDESRLRRHDVPVSYGSGELMRRLTGIELRLDIERLCRDLLAEQQAGGAANDGAR